MPEQIRVPAYMGRDELADLLERLARSVRSRDSLEGSLEYLLPAEDDNIPAGGDWVMVTAALRTGNLMGQGGMTMIGRWAEKPEETDGNR